MTDEEKLEMSKWSYEQYDMYRDWLTLKFHTMNETFGINSHKQPCDCDYCRGFKERTRRRMKREVIRKAK